MRKLTVLLLALLLSGCTTIPMAEVSPPASDAPAVESAEPSPSAPSESDAAPEPEPEPEPEPYDFTLPVPAAEPVEDEWFADAVIIGDSRTDGFRKFSGLKTPTVLAYTGLTIFDFSTRAVLSVDGETMTADAALSRLSPAKIYLSLGLNELGWRDNNGFYTQYGLVVDRIRELHPDAQIYLQLLIPVHAGKCEANNQPYYVTNEQIDLYNDLIRQVAAEKEVYFLDLHDEFADEAGEIPREMTGDGVHLNREGYQKWAEYLRAHTIETKEANPR